MSSESLLGEITLSKHCMYVEVDHMVLQWVGMSLLPWRTLLHQGQKISAYKANMISVFLDIRLALRQQRIKKTDKSFLNSCRRSTINAFSRPQQQVITSQMFLVKALWFQQLNKSFYMACEWVTDNVSYCFHEWSVVCSVCSFCINE